MARLVLVTHEFDRFVIWRKRWPPRTSLYLLFDVLREVEKLGHSWRVTAGPNPVKGDVALMHVDCTVSTRRISRFDRTILEHIISTRATSRSEPSASCA